LIFQSIPPAASATTQKTRLISHSITSATSATTQTTRFIFQSITSPAAPPYKKHDFLMHYFRSNCHHTKDKVDFPLRLLVSQQDPTNKEIYRMHFVYIHPFPARDTSRITRQHR
jgi:hypothetical protein